MGRRGEAEEWRAFGAFRNGAAFRTVAAVRPMESGGGGVASLQVFRNGAAFRTVAAVRSHGGRREAEEWRAFPAFRTVSPSAPQKAARDQAGGGGEADGIVLEPPGEKAGPDIAADEVEAGGEVDIGCEFPPTCGARE